MKKEPHQHHHPPPPPPPTTTTTTTTTTRTRTRTRTAQQQVPGNYLGICKWVLCVFVNKNWIFVPKFKIGAFFRVWNFC